MFNNIIVFALTYRWWIAAIVFGIWAFNRSYETGFDPKMQTNDMKRVWIVWGNRVAMFGATMFVLVSLVVTIANWAIPTLYTSITTSPITQTNDQMAADAIKVVGSLFSANGTTASTGTDPLTALVAAPAVAPASGPVVPDLTSVLSSISTSASGAVNAVMDPASVAAPVVAPVQAPASASGDFKVVAPVAAPVVQPAAIQAAPQQGPANITHAWDNVAKPGTQTMWGNQPSVVAPVVQPAPVQQAPVVAPVVEPAYDFSKKGFWDQFKTPESPGGGGPTVHIVVSGDTMFKLAKRYGVHLSAMCDLNRNVAPNCNVLHSGTELMVPAK